MADRGFTLLELLISISMGMLMIAATWTAFVRVKATTSRATVRIGLHAAAASVRDAMATDLRCLAPSLAVFVRSLPATVSADARTETVEILFMRSAAPLRTPGMRSDRDQRLADHYWVRWRQIRSWRMVEGAWVLRTASLRRSESTPTRSWTTTSALAPPAPVVDPADGSTHADYDGALWINIPRPLRDASQGPASLDNNRYGVPQAAIAPGSPHGDIGDLADLDANEVMVSDEVRDLSIGWTRADGEAELVGSTSAADHRIDGLYLDGLGPAGSGASAIADARPQLVRIALLMARGEVQQELSFSVATAGPRAQVEEAVP